MPKISQHSYDTAVVAVRRDHPRGVSVLKVYRSCMALLQTVQGADLVVLVRILLW